MSDSFDHGVQVGRGQINVTGITVNTATGVVTVNLSSGFSNTFTSTVISNLQSDLAAEEAKLTRIYTRLGQIENVATPTTVEGAIARISELD